MQRRLPEVKGMSVREKDNPGLFRKVEEENQARQYGLMDDCIEIGLEKGIEAFDKYSLWALNHAATANIVQFGGRYREGPVSVGKHVPPPYWDVPELMDRFISFVHENWEKFEGTTTMAAFALWRINWIHPFVEGNGRTARAACYWLICMRRGAKLPGRKIVPERIRETRAPYYAALQAADRAYKNGHYDVSELADYLQGLLKEQLKDR